jgi:hypothetical protein
MCEKFPQSTQYTYTCLNRDSTFYSKLDHVLTIQDDQNAHVDIDNCKIQNDPSNTSDHNALRLEFILSGNNNNNHDPTVIVNNNNLDFEIDEINNFYNQEIDSNIDNMFERFDRPLEVQVRIDLIYSDLFELILDAKESTLSYQNTIKPQNKSPPEQNNNKKWFTPEIKRTVNSRPICHGKLSILSLFAMAN